MPRVQERGYPIVQARAGEIPSERVHEAREFFWPDVHLEANLFFPAGDLFRKVKPFLPTGMAARPLAGETRMAIELEQPVDYAFFNGRGHGQGYEDLLVHGRRGEVSE
jgi:hypothetical protein